MDMISSQLAAASQPAAGLNLGQGQTGKGGDASAFRNVLVHYIGGTASGQTAGNASTEPSTLTVQLDAILTNGSAAALPDLEELAALIDSLIESLENDEASDQSASSDEQTALLQESLDQLDALLALLGAPIIRFDQLQAAMTANQAEDEADIGSSSAQVKNALQTSLLQLQSLLQQGSLKQVQQQNPVQLIERQLAVLTSVINGDSNAEPKAGLKSEAANPAWLTAKPAASADSSSLLQRMTDRAFPSAIMAGSLAAKTADQTVRSESVAIDSEPIAAAQLAVNHPDSFRAPLVMAKAAAPISYVMADEFAQSMSGLIVQKFDVTSLNGISEAKIMLYPEHLGQVDVRITMQNGQLTATFHTENAMAKDMLENQMAQLRLALQGQGITVDKIEVSQNQSAAQLFQQQHGQNGNPQQQSNRQPVKDEESIKESAFESELVEQAAIQGLGYGRTINASV